MEKVISDDQLGCVWRFYSVVLGTNIFKSTLLELGDAKSFTIFIKVCVWDICISVIHKKIVISRLGIL